MAPPVHTPHPSQGDQAARILIDGQALPLDSVSAVAVEGRKVGLASVARDQMAASRTTVERLVATATPAYGITTGIGSLSDRVIPPERARELQVNLLLSHATGAGEPLPV